MADIDPNIKLYIKEEIEKVMRLSSTLYAIKLVEKIVFYIVGAVAIAVLAAVLKLVIIP